MSAALWTLSSFLAGVVLVGSVAASGLAVDRYRRRRDRMALLLALGVTLLLGGAEVFTIVAQWALGHALPPDTEPSAATLAWFAVTEQALRFGGVAALVGWLSVRRGGG